MEGSGGTTWATGPWGESRPERRVARFPSASPSAHPVGARERGSGLVDNRVVDAALRERCRNASERSRDRRERVRRLRRRRLRTRGGALSLAALALVTAVVGAGVAAGQSGEVVLERGDRGPAVALVQ